jgi:predicted nucleotidyltransferase
MVYTEIKEKNGKKYYYRVKSMREGSKFKKERIYLGKNLPKSELILKEEEADTKLNIEKKVKKSKALKILIKKIKKILEENKIQQAGIFGSYARGEQRKESDIDILIQPAKDMSLLDISGLKIELEKILGKKVDIVSYNYIHPYLKNKILESEVKII